MKSASGHPTSPVNAENTDSNDIRLEELRHLVFGPELVQISRLTQRLDDPERRAEDLSQILPLAKVRKSLEQSIKAILRREPDVVMEAIRPVLLVAVRKAVADAFREFSESLNQIAEKSLSLRSLRWRFEAARTGRKFSDIMLSRSLLYSVREVFLIHRNTGIMLNQATRAAVANDADMISSMFTAIQEFVRDSFIGTGDTELETIDTGAFKLWIQHGAHAMLAGAVDGTPPVELRSVFRGALDEIQQNFTPELSNFNGNVTPFEPALPILERCLLGRSAKPRKPVLRWIFAAALCLALLGAWAYFVIVSHKHWNNYVAQLEKQPGILVTRVEDGPPGHVVFGLRDRLARDPAALLMGTGVSPSKVEFRLEPYDSLDPTLVAKKQFLRDGQSLQRVFIRFPQGKADLSPASLDRIDDQLAPAISSLLQAAHVLHSPVQIQVTGHTDELGTEQSNTRLSIDRAENVRTALLDAGVDTTILAARGVATSEPVRQGSSDRDRSSNRSVTFIIRPDLQKH